MTRQSGIRNCRKRDSKNNLHSRTQARWPGGGSCHEAQAFSLKSVARINKAEQSSSNAMEETPIRGKSGTHTVARMVSNRNSTGEDYRRSKIHDYLRSRGIIHLLDNIPRPDNVQFVDQRSLFYAWPKKLLIGHHAHSGYAIHAYLIPSTTSHRVEVYAEHDHRHTRLSLDREGLARHHFLVPFNKTYPQDAQKITKADIARVELLIEWYFIETGVVPADSGGVREGFGKQLCNALRYIGRRAELLPRYSRHQSPVPTHHRASVGHEWSPSSPHVSEDDIQLSLLQQYCLKPWIPFTPVRVK
jgi:hypothetical protein